MRTILLNTYIIFALVALTIFLAPGAQAQVAPTGFEVETVASGLILPVAVDFSSHGDIFVAEKGGVVRLIQDGISLS